MHQALNILNTKIQQKLQAIHFSDYRQDCEQVHNQRDIKYLTDSSIYGPVLSQAYI